MPRKLKTYTTSLGFFDLAVAVPSMKAALEAWGANHNLFHQGFAKETTDPAITRATMARPGVVLKRPAGARGEFKENADLLERLPATNAETKSVKSHRVPATKEAEIQDDPVADRKATTAYKKERDRQEQKRRKEQAERERQRKKTELSVRKAEEALSAAQANHDKAVVMLANVRAKLEKRAGKENERWRKEKRKLDAKIKNAQR